jgi:hypothetical protein
MARDKTMAPQRTILSMPPDLKERIRTFRFSAQINTEAEAIRQLIEMGLEVADKRASKAKK